MKLRWLLSLMLLLLMAPILIAQDDEKADSKQEEEPTIAEQFRDAKRAFSKLRSKQRKETRNATNEEKEAINLEFADATEELGTKVLGLVEGAEEAEALQMLVWVIESSQGDIADSAVETLMSEFNDSEELAAVARSFARKPGPDSEALLRKLIEVSPHDKVKGYATMSLASMLSSLSSFHDASERRQKRMLESIGDGGEAFMTKWSAKAIDAEVEQLFESIVENYSDVDAGRGTLGEMAESKLFEMRYLQIGKVAPDIEGADLDEVEFKLSDYRGKVVVIDFWGDW